GPTAEILLQRGSCAQYHIYIRNFVFPGRGHARCPFSSVSSCTLLCMVAHSTAMQSSVLTVKHKHRT
ncbi:unnamed protein product, partial [Staurois parvus]